MAEVSDITSETTLQLYTNPLLIQDKQLSLFEEYIFNGRAVLDGNNVFTFGLEMDASMTAGIVNEMMNGFQSLYPARAMTMSDLYRHMSDYDYIDMFSTPAGTTIELMFDRDFLINNAPLNTTGADYNKVVIPEHSVFTIGEHKFGIHYPIEIQIRKSYEDAKHTIVDYDHCLFQCQWDTSVPNPLHKLTTNVLEHRIYQREGLNLLCISIPIEQFKIDTKTEDSISSTGYIKRYVYTDNFYAARVFHFYNNQWIELSSTLSDVIYNTSQVTAKIKVLSDIHVLEVSIPQIYFTDGMIGNRIRTIIYTTEGAMDIDIRTYGPEQFAASFLIDDMVMDDTYSAFLKRIPFLQVVPLSSRISNGSNGKSFDVMKERVINTIGGDDLLVTPGQVSAYLSDIGFDVSKYIDNITNRIYIARRAITSSNGTIVTSGEYKTTVTAAMLAEADDGEIAGEYDTIKVVDKLKSQFVIMPNTIFKYDKKTDCMVPLSLTERNNLYSIKTSEEFTKEMNDNIYSFTPFHIKLSTDGNLPMAGAYDLTNPSLSKITFTNENEMTNTQVSMFSFDIKHLNNGTGGYLLAVSLFKTKDLANVAGAANNLKGTENISVILRATNCDNMDVYLRGTYNGQDANHHDIYLFYITTDYEIDADDTINSNAFTPINDFATEPINSRFELEQKFELLFFVSEKYITDADARARSYAENNIPIEMRNSKMVWVATQECMIKLGEPISSLMTNTFINIKGKTYASYLTTTYAAYVVDLYERDINGIPVLDDNGQLIVTHPAGSLILSSVDDTQPDLRLPACEFKWLENDSTEQRKSVLYMNPDHPSVNASDENIWDPYRIFKDASDNKWYGVVTGQHKIYVTDFLGDVINTIANNQKDLIVENASALQREVLEIDGEFVLSENIAGEFVFVENTTQDTARVPRYTIYCSNNNMNDPKFVLTDFLEVSDHLAVKDDYNSCVLDASDKSVITGWKVVSVDEQDYQYGALYRKDPNKANFNYKDYVTNETLAEFYKLVDNNGGKITKTICNMVSISMSVATQLIDMRNPWVKMIEAGNFAIIKAYWDHREYNNFDMNLTINTQRGVAALSFMQSQSKFLSAIPRYATMDDVKDDNGNIIAKGAISAVDNATSYGLVWCDNYDITKDASSETSTLISIDGQNVPLISEDLGPNLRNNIGALLWPGSISQHSSLHGKHYAVIIGPDINTCYQHLMNINTYSGLAYICEEYDYGDGNNITNIKDGNDYCFGDFDGLSYFCKYKLTEQGDRFLEGVEYYRKNSANNKYYKANYLINIGDLIPANLYYIKEKVGMEKKDEFTKLFVNGILFPSDKSNYAGRYINIIDEDTNFFNSSWIAHGGYWPWETSNWADEEGKNLEQLGITFTISDETDAKILHLAGDVILDENGIPVINREEDERQLMYRINMVHVDQKVVESNNTDYATFRDDVRELLRGYFNRLESAKMLMLERTELYYAPTQSMGYGIFKGDNDENMLLPLEFSLDLRLHVLSTVSGDSTMKETVRANVLNIIRDHANTGIINCAILAEQIRSSMSDVIQFVDVLGINGDPNVQTLISTDVSKYTPRLKTILVVRDDGSIDVDKALNLVWSTIK